LTPIGRANKGRPCGQRQAALTKTSGADTAGAQTKTDTDEPRLHRHAVQTTTSGNDTDKSRQAAQTKKSLENQDKKRKQTQAAKTNKSAQAKTGCVYKHKLRGRERSEHENKGPTGPVDTKRSL
jgi:hypothetical protein